MSLQESLFLKCDDRKSKKFQTNDNFFYFIARLFLVTEAVDELFKLSTKVLTVSFCLHITDVLYTGGHMIPTGFAY